MPLSGSLCNQVSTRQNQAITHKPYKLPFTPMPPTTTSFADMEFSWLKDVWSSKTAKKLKLFMWSIIIGALPVGMELQRRGMISESLCPRCC